MEAIITALLLLSFFLFPFLNSFFHFPSSKLLPWLHSLLLSTISPLPNTTKPPIPTQQSSLQPLFSTFDTDGDGFISLQELSESLGRLGFPISEAGSVMEKADSNGDGLIDLDEFRELCSSRGDEDEAELREAFAVFDGNGDGKIAVEELSLVMKSLGMKQGIEACKDMIKRVDMDGDGMVDFEEFKMMMASEF